MDITLLRHGKNPEGRPLQKAEEVEITCTRPFRGAGFVVAASSHIEKCPFCHATPLQVAGFKGPEVVRLNTHYSAAGCKDCRKHLGTLKVVSESLFGEEEDKRILHGRCRIY